MIRRPLLDLFCEDAGHEAFARALISRLAAEAGVPRPDLSVRSSRGGHGKAITELQAWQQSLVRGGNAGYVLVVLIDANGAGWGSQHRAVVDAIQSDRFEAVIVGIPDPHVEAWCAADPEALRKATGAVVSAPPARPGRNGYKRWLGDCLEAAGVEILNDPMDIAAELVPHMDLYRAGKQSPSLGLLTADLRALFARSRAARGTP